MNLAYYYPIIYWNCACLSVDASAINELDFDNLLDQGIVGVSEDEDIRETNKTDYAKIVVAINRFKKTCNITTPDINKSKLGFMPDVENNRIIYGLRGITRITAPVIQEIMEHRPYINLNDFCMKVNKRIVTRDKIVYLIKSGAFNNIENNNERNILQKFIMSTCDQKKRLTLQNANMLIDYELLPADLDEEKAIFKLTKLLRQFRDENKTYYLINDQMDRDLISKYMSISTIQLENGRVVEAITSNEWDNKVYTRKMLKVKTYISEHAEKMLELLNNKLFMDDWIKYASGDELQWQLDSLSMYTDKTPLDNIGKDLPVSLSSINEIEEGKVEGFFLIKGKQIPKMHLYTIAGTVLQKNTTKGMVTVQTPDGIVNMKLYKDLFAFFSNDTDNVGSFFEKGVHLMITGVLKGTTFIPKVYKNTGVKAIVKIELDEHNNFVRLINKEKVDES
jgi:DNA polymerase III subunit alpha